MTRKMLRNNLLLGSLVVFSLVVLLWPTRAAQPVATNAKVLDGFVARNIGPAKMGGRVTSIAGVDDQPNIVYVGTASGGVWKTTDSGATWTPIFDNQSSVSVGDIAVSQSNPNIVWVGTGEHNPRNSVAWGDGVYKSTDGGKTWQHMGLKDSHSIGRVVIHPKNPDIVYVGIMGHTWGPNKERGIFKTIDGGKTWQVSKVWDENTGVIELKMDPTDPDTLYAAAWQVRRDAFSGGEPAVVYGPNAGLYKTSDGGKKWDKMTNGLPTGPYNRCGIDIYCKDPNVIYAIVQAKGGQAGTHRSDDKGKTWRHLNTNVPRPMYFGQIRVDPNDDKRIYVLGVNLFVSDDGGKTFDTRGSKNLGNPNNTTHADHHAMWINPKNSSEIFNGNDGGIWHSKDKAKTFQMFVSMSLGQYYGISCDMRKPYWVFGGCQDNGGFGTPSATTDFFGIRNNLVINISGGDGFHTQNDPTDFNIVYTESQNGGLQRVDLSKKKGKGKGDGDDPDDPGLDGEQKQDEAKKAEQKKDEPKKDEQKKDEPKKDEQKKDPQQKKGGGKAGGIKPAGNDNRWNWSTPMLLSPHDPKVFYCGSQYLYMSTERGSNPKAISPDLTYGKGGGGGKGAGGAHSLFTIGESPKKKGVLWTGSDDGRIMVSLDTGGKWTDVSSIPGVPKERCISRVEPSHYTEGTCYVSLTRYRNDDRKPYIFRTTDFGKTWENVAGNLPIDGSVHVVIESSKNKNLLFCGTEFGLFVSLDAGKTWNPMKGGMPTVSVHDIVLHPRDRDLVVGTHGRSIFIFDDISPLEQVSPDMLDKAAHLFDIRPAVAFKQTKGAAPKSNEFLGTNPPYGAIIRYHLKDAAKAVSITIQDGSGKAVAQLKGGTAAGLNQVVWNLRADAKMDATVAPGEYVAVLEVAGQKLTQKVRVVAE